MHRKFLRAAAAAVVLGGTVTLGPVSTQAALANPAPTFVPCGTSLGTAISDADNGAVLALAPGCTYWLTETGLPMINKTLTIVGYDSSITRSYAADTPSFTIFSVSYLGDLTLDNVNVRNGDGNDNGGAISNVNGIVTINGGTFSDNHAAYGGAIYSDDGTGTVTINGATFKGNDASAEGGAIYNDDGATVTIHGSTFIGNHATDYGGAIYNDSNLTAAHAKFGLNTADYGGAVYNDDDGPISLTGGVIMFNRASEQDGGGGVYNINGGTATLTGVTIMFNTPENCVGTITGC